MGSDFVLMSEEFVSVVVRFGERCCVGYVELACGVKVSGCGNDEEL